MTQKQLNNMWKKIEEAEDYDEAIENYWAKLEKMGARRIYCDWKEHGAVVEEFTNLMSEYGFRIFTDPEFEGTDSYGYVIFPPDSCT